MNAIETAAIVNRLAVAYNTTATEDLFALWNDHLAHLDPEIGFAATERLIDSTDGFFPTFSRWKDAYNAERRARAVKVPLLPPARPGVTDEGRRLIAEARANLRRPKEDA